MTSPAPAKTFFRNGSSGTASGYSRGKK